MVWSGCEERVVQGSKREKTGVYTVYEELSESSLTPKCEAHRKPTSRTRKLSSSADGSWGFPPVRVGRCQANMKRSVTVTDLFLCVNFKNREVLVLGKMIFLH